MDMRIVMYYNGLFYCFTPALNGLMQYPVCGYSHFLEPDSSNELLGKFALDWYSVGSDLLIRHAEYGFDVDKWISYIKETYQIDTKQRIFRLMKQCNFDDNGDNRYAIQPMFHKSGDSFFTKKGDGIRRVFISKDSSHEAIGKAIRTGFTRCLGSGAD